jgi:hypothetical protein
MNLFFSISENFILNGEWCIGWNVNCSSPYLSYLLYKYILILYRMLWTECIDIGKKENKSLWNIRRVPCSLTFIGSTPDN